MKRLLLAPAALGLAGDHRRGECRRHKLRHRHDLECSHARRDIHLDQPAGVANSSRTIRRPASTGGGEHPLRVSDQLL